MKTIVLEQMPDYFWSQIEQKGVAHYFNKNDLDSAIAIIRTQTVFDKSLIKKFPKLKMIIRAGSGFDNIDYNFAKSLGILITNTPKANVQSAFEHTISLIFAMLKQHQKGKISIVEGGWKPTLLSNWEFADVKAAVVGVGRIGSLVATFLCKLGATVVGVDPFLTSEQKRRYPFDFVSYRESLDFCNLMTFHTPLYKVTRHYFAKSSIKRLSNPIWLINCSRGGVVDETILQKALADGFLLGVGLDVFETEPSFLPQFKENPNIFLTPHTGAYTEGAKRRMCDETLHIWEDFCFADKFQRTIDERFVDDFGEFK